jgi:Leucine-rich repeat (LRR) protein
MVTKQTIKINKQEEETLRYFCEVHKNENKGRPGLNAGRGSCLLNYDNLLKLAHMDNSTKGLIKLDIYGLYIDTFPSELSELKNLKELKISLNYGNLGTISAQHIPIYGQHDTPLIPIPKEINRFKHIKRLNIAGTYNKELPAELYELNKLESLILARSGIETISPNIQNLSNLQYLDLENNNFTYLPNEISKLANLKTLKLLYNPIQQLPESMQELNLDTLEIDYRPLNKNSLKTLDVLASKGTKILNSVHNYWTKPDYNPNFNTWQKVIGAVKLNDSRDELYDHFLSQLKVVNFVDPEEKKELTETFYKTLDSIFSPASKI